MLQAVNCRAFSSSCASSPHWSTQSTTQRGLFHKLLMSPKISSFVNYLDRRISDQTSFCWDSDKEVVCSSISSLPPNDTPKAKSTEELKDEIATLELQIMHLEQHLLSLYRTAFEGQQYLSTLPSTPSYNTQINRISLSKISSNQSRFEYESRIQRNSSSHHNQTSNPHSWTSSCNHQNAASARPSLADLLGSSSIHDTFKSPDKLSEDIVRCISSIYCKLASPPQSQGALLASPPSLWSSSSSLSSTNPCDSWSPSCNEDSKATQHQELTHDSRPYAAMIEVLKICLDDDSFKYAATILQNFRSLVRKLEKVDPRKMKREEKLAFWINIHNSMIMHAYLAYGTCSRIKSTSILKAAYNIGGHCIDAFIIQSSILGIRTHYSTPLLQTLFTGKRHKAGSIRVHEYALEYPEPLVHFALCSGAYSDPAVRVYTANHVFQDLKLAKEEYVQAGVYINKETKVFLPKILYYFAKDMSLSIHELMRVVADSLPEVQRKTIKSCIKGRQVDKCIQWLPRSSSFRYMIHRELVKGCSSV